MEWAAGSPHPAHPRAGGENWVQRDDAFTPAGSSPRGRGKLVDLGSELSDLGLIPARAGKTGAGHHAFFAGGAHPRAGGENIPPGSRRVWIEGSSPRGRGKPTQDRITSHDVGLIPARAGKTSIVWSTMRRRTAHPRAGGENARITHREHDGGAHPRAGGENEAHCLVPSGVYGSSPRGRGKLIPVILSGILHGLIPARAGKTWPSA